MDDNTLYRLLTAIISSGYIANETLYKFHGDNGILQESMTWARTIMGEKFNHSEKPKQEREFTGFTDRNGTKIYDGDIFIYLDYTDLKYVPDDFIENYADKYSNRVSLHPVFWDEDKGAWCSDVYRDSDYLAYYHSSSIVVVTNNIEHPELYNH